MKSKETPVLKRPELGRPAGAPKIAVTIMLPVTTKERLDHIVKQTGMDRGTFVDEALQRHFAYTAPPDFAKRFAQEPAGPWVGDQLVQLLLADREENKI